jgi:hypothetical protein
MTRAKTNLSLSREEGQGGVESPRYAHRLHFAIDVGIGDVFGWGSRGQLRDQIFEASIHLGLGKSTGHTGASRLIEAVDDTKEVFEAEPHVGDGDLRRAKSFVTILHSVLPRRLSLRKA